MFGRKRKVQQAEIEALRSTIGALRTDLAAQKGAQTEFERRITQVTAIAGQQVNDQADQVKAVDFSVANLQQVINGMNQRLDEVGRTLTDQLREVSGEVDALGERVVEADDLLPIRAAQVRLANEQARYEIAIRAELAALGEQLRKGKS